MLSFSFLRPYRSYGHMMFLACWASLSLTLLVSCGGDDNPVKNAAEAVKNVVDKPALMKTWVSNCDKSTLLDSSSRQFYEFAGADFTRVREFYNEEDCRIAVARLQYGGRFEVKGDVAEVPNAEQINLHYTKVTMLPLTDDGVQKLNDLKFCGLDNWASNKAEDLTERSRLTDVSCPVGSMPKDLYQIFLIESDRLYLGKAEHEPVESGLRPTTMDRDNVLYKTERSFH